jgi:hypothetical protein
MSWNDGPTLLSKFSLHLQGSYQMDWQKILHATDPNEQCYIDFFKEHVQNMLSTIFAKGEWSEIANFVHTWCKTPRLMTTKQVHELFLSFDYDYTAGAHHSQNVIIHPIRAKTNLISYVSP